MVTEAKTVQHVAAVLLSDSTSRLLVKFVIFQHFYLSDTFESHERKAAMS